MTPEQERAHNMLTHTLWPEWVAFCTTYWALRDAGNSTGSLIGEWCRLAESTLNAEGLWEGPYLENYIIAGEVYLWPR